MKPIVTVTANPALDVSFAVERVEATKKLRSRDVRRDAGGGGINVARAIRELGGDACAIFAAGGADGARLHGLLADENVSCQTVEIDGETRQSFTAYEEATGHEYRFVLPGPTLSDDECAALVDAVAERQAGFVVISGSFPNGVPEDICVRLVSAAKARGANVVLDTSDGALMAGLDEGVYLVKPNLRELRELTNRSLETRESRVASARQLVTDGKAKIVTVTLGAEGCLLVWNEGALLMPAPEVETRSSVGAGDSFVGATVLRLAQGADVPTAVRYGLAAGSAALLTPGTALCRRKKVDDLYDRLDRRSE